MATPDFSIPSYMTASDNHNLGNLNPALGDIPEDDTPWVDKATYFAGASLASGVNSFYNTGVSVGNWFSGDEAQYRDTRDWIASFDENMASYYDQNRQAADLVGFVVSSFVPGLGGVKVFNAGSKALMAAREGAFGINMSRGLGVLPGARDLLVKEATEAYATSQAAFAFTEARTLKAIASGFGEQALQSAAFEISVAATMHKSPILDGQSTGDLISNIAWGTLVGGGIGGAIEGALATYAIKSGIRKIDAKIIGATQYSKGVEGTSASDNLLIFRNDLESTQINVPEGVSSDLYRSAYENKLRHLDNESRKEWTTIAGGDSSLGNRMHEITRVEPTAALSSKLLNLEEVAPVSETGKIAKKYSLNREPGTFGAEEAGKYATRSLKMWGEEAGKLSDDAPGALHLADTLPKGKTLKVSASGVEADGAKYVVKKEEFWTPKTAAYKDAMARSIWAMDDTVPKLAIPKGADALRIGAEDIPMLTKAYREGFNDFVLLNAKGETISRPGNREELLSYIAKQKDDVASKLLSTAFKQGKDAELSAEKISNMVDAPLSYLSGTQVPAQLEEAIFGLRNAQKTHYQKFYANNDNAPAIESVKPWLEPQHYTMVYDTSRLGGIDNFQVEAMTIVKQRQILQQQSLEIAVASSLGDRASLLPEFNDATLRSVNRGGSGSGFISYSNANYGTAGSIAEYVGSLVTKWTQRNTEVVGNTFSGVNYALVNSAEDTARVAAIMQKTRQAGGNLYVLSEDGTGLVLRASRDYERALARGENATPPVLAQGIDETIPFGNDIVKNWITQHIEFTGMRNQKFNALRHSKGQYDSYDPATFYPPAPNPDRFKFHAFASDNDKIISTGHTNMLYADSAENLSRQIAEAKAQGYQVYTKGETADYFKARGEYDYSKGFNENQFDASMTRGGSSAPLFPLTGNPQEMIQDIMQWHKRQEDILVRESVSTKYSRQFGTLHAQGEQYALPATSQRGGFFSKFQSEVKNPYEDYIKTFLGASRIAEYPLWKALNDGIDTVGSKVWNSVTSIFQKAKTPYDLEQVNKVLGEYGIQNAATPAQLEAWVNHPAGTGAVSRFISQQNSILSSLILRLDPINALNNAVGSTILTGAETKAVLRAIGEGNTDVAGDLAKLSQINLPGTGDAILSPQKLMANAYRNFFKDDGSLLSKYKDMGVAPDTLSQFKSLIETVTIDGTETASRLNDKIQKGMSLAKSIGDIGERVTGNKLAESMNRFVSANIMDQLTGLAIKSGAMDERVAGSYINTFVNRTQGNTVASQRPQLFQGPLGQALGLFQSYQFNIMQQLLRYVGEGSKKDALTLLGLQSTIYGANGLPAFQAINTHIIGNASGNTSHTDAYSSINNVAGKSAGDWLTYGLSSNFLIHPDLKINLYSRGDINPRSVTVVPSNLAELPIIGAWGKMFQTVKGGMTAVANGGDVWNTFLSGVEHQGINRPLSGIARVARGASDEGISFSTTGKGNIVSANDFYSLSNLSRITGAKPLDEAVTQDAVFRVQSYSRRDKELRDNLGVAVRSTITGGGEPTAEQLEKFMTNYAKIGGKQEEFNRWYVGQLRAANTPQANKLVEKVGSPYSKYMQDIMGGRSYKTPQNIMSEQSAPAPGSGFDSE